MSKGLPSLTTVTQPSVNCAVLIGTPTQLTRTWAAVFLASFVLYAMTAARVVGWQDFGHFVQRVAAGELLNPLGLALAHPLHYWIARIAVIALPLQPPFAVSLVSALFGAIAVANVFGLGAQLTGRIAPALLAAAGLAIAHTWWRMSTMAEVYTLTTALLTVEIWSVALWVRTRHPRWLLLMFLANGLGLSNHNLALLTLPLIGLLLLAAMYHRQAGLRHFVGALLVWLVGSSLYTGLIIQQMLVTGHVADTIRSALFGHGFQDQVLSHTLPWRHIVISVAFTLLSFPNLTLPAALLGIVRGRRVGMPPVVWRVLLVALVIHVLFTLRYNVVDQYTFLMPSFAMAAIFAAVGFGVIATRWPARRWQILWMTALAAVLLTPCLYLAVPPLARHFQVIGADARNKPYRDDYNYLFRPGGRGDTSADRMSRQAADLAGPNGVIIVEDPMAAFAVRYQIQQRGWNNVTVLGKLSPEELQPLLAGDRPLVLIPANTQETPSPNIWRSAGELYVARR